MNSLDIVVAFGGGIFGAAVGALAAFEFVGLLVIAMTVVQIITGASSDFITFPFGLFGPHTGGFAAARRRRLAPLPCSLRTSALIVNIDVSLYINPATGDPAAGRLSASRMQKRAAL